MQNFTKEEIQRAKQVSILQVAERCGIHVHKVGNSKYSWRSVENSGLVFSEMKNTFFMHSALFGQAQGTGGSTIDFIQMMTQANFKEAVSQLLNENYEQVEIKRDENLRKAPFKDYFISSSNTTIIQNYLTQERKIDPRIVQALLNKNYLKEDAYHQVIFYWGRHGAKVGATVQGTTYDPERFGKRGRFKGIAMNSESDFGFNIQLGNRIQGLYIFESPIDVLSYWSLHPTLQNAMLASVDGTTKTSPVFNFMNYLAMNHHFDEEKALDKFQVFIGSDNDEAGRNFVQKLIQTPVVRQQAPEYAHNRLFVANPPSQLFKDWNEQLQFVASVYEQDQYVSFSRNQVAKIDRQRGEGYDVRFVGQPFEEFQGQQTLFQAKSWLDVNRLLDQYDFERISKHDLERLGLSAFDRQAVKSELKQDKNLEGGIQL